MFNRLSLAITKWLLNSGAISSNDEELYSYIVNSSLFSCTPLILVLIIGAASNMLVEGMIMILPFLLIRKFSGGFHFKSQYICLVFSCILLAFSLLSVEIITKYENYSVCSSAVLASTLVLSINSPIDSTEQKLSIKEKKWFKAITISLCLIFLIVYSILALCNKWSSGVPLGIGIVIPAFLQLPCLFLRLSRGALRAIFHKM